MKYTDYLRWGTIAAVFLVLLVPFIIAVGTYFPNLFFPFITGKNFVFRILVEAALFCYVLLALREPKYRPRASLIMWCTVLFVGWMAIATITAVDPIKSFWSNFERMEGYVGLLHLFVWFIISGAILTTEDLWERFFNTSAGLAAVQGVWALLQVTGYVAISSQSGARADTTFGNAAYLAVYFLLNFFITLWLFVRQKEKTAGTQVFYGLALVLQFMGLYFTETRGALLGLLGGLVITALYLAIFGRGREYRVVRRVSIGGLVALVVLAAGFFALRDSTLVHKSSTLARVASISLSDRTTISRFQIWGMALKGFEEKPLLGWGQENFSYVFNKYYNPNMYDQEAWFDRAHDQFLDWLIAGGAPAFVLYVALYALAVFALWRSSMSKAEKAVLIGLFAGYIFNNLFVFDNLVSAMYFFALLAFTHGLSRKELPSRVWLSKPLGQHTMAIVAPIVFLVVAIGGFALNAPGLARASTLIDALQTQVATLSSSGQIVAGQRPPQQNLASYVSALKGVAWPGNPLGYQEVVEQLLQFASNQAASSSVDPSVKFNIFTTSSGAVTTLMQQRKDDARLELFAATLLGAFGQTSDALTHLQAALKDSPGKQQILIQIGGVELGAGNTQAAVTAFKQAFEEAPAYETARIYYAASLYAAGQNAEGDQLLQEGFGSTVVDNDQLLSAYMSLKLYSRAIAIWQLRVQKSPQDAQTYLGLASTYFQLGDKTDTIATLKKIEQIQPAAAGQMETLIKQIEDGTLKPQH